MTTYYFDIETYSPSGVPNPDSDKIITIQFQRIDLRTGEPIGNLVILKEWESSEEAIVKQLYDYFFQEGTSVWSFVPVGFNLAFEWEFLISKFKKYLGKEFSSRDFHYNRPQIDLKSTIVLMNSGQFKGASLDKFSYKFHNGESIKRWYEEKNFAEIENYIKIEANAFLGLLRKINFCLGEFWRYHNEEGTIRTFERP